MNSITKNDLATAKPLTCPKCNEPVSDFHVVQDATVTFPLSHKANTRVPAWTTDTPSINYLDEIVIYALPCNCEILADDGDAVIHAIELLGGFSARPE